MNIFISIRPSLRKIAKSLYIFLKAPNEVKTYVQPGSSDSSNNCVHHYNVEIFNLFDPALQLISTKPVIKDKLKDFFKWVEKVWISVSIVLRL